MISRRRLPATTFLFVGVAWLVLTGCQAPQPPAAKIVPHTTRIHNQVRVDNYHWLRDRNDLDVVKYLDAENEYARSVMRHTKPLQDKLYKEMLGRIKETDMNVPVKDGDYYYYTRTSEGKQYRVYCRKKDSLDSDEEILLDQNKLAGGHNYLQLGAFKTSPNHNLLAYSTDTQGAELFTLRIKDLETGKLLPDAVPNTHYGVAWANDNKTLYYTTLDAAKRPYRLYCHTLGTDPQQDRLVYEEKDEMFRVWLDKSRSKQYLFLITASGTTSEVRFLDANKPTDEFTVIHPREHKVEYHVAHHDDHFYIVTNDGAKNFKAVRAPIASPSKGNWEEVIPHRPEIKVDGADMFKNYMVVHEREEGLKKIHIKSFKNGSEYYISFPEPVYTCWPGDNREFDANVFRFHYTSLVTPRSVFDYDMDSRTRELKKQVEVLGDYDPEQYQSKRIFARAKDGTRIPISMVYRKGMNKSGTNPTLLYGYGSYGASMDPWFSSNILSLLDRGFIYAIAHIRGGGELGRPWYDDGKLLNKKNTFTDFIACAEHLIAEDYTDSDHLAISGASAGGLLVGAAANMRPGLFRAVSALVPFVDVINTMLDPSIPLTVIEYEEWGNPNEKEFFDYMLSYSPYDNVEAKPYPHIFVRASLNDPRVAYWEPAKWVAKLRTMKADDNLLLLETNMGAGHGGSSGRYDYLKEIAVEYAFFLDVLEIKD